MHECLRAEEIWRNILFLLVKKPQKLLFDFINTGIPLFLIAHARLMFRDTVTLEDAVTVVSVMESSMQVRLLADIAIAAIPLLRDSVLHVDMCQLPSSLWKGFYRFIKSR